MASELLKRNALIQKLKEPDVPEINFDLQSTGFEELFTLPEPKPEELLNIQEENRKGRLLDALNIIGGGLEDTSLDFIKREELNIGTRPENINTPRENLKRLAELIQQADIDDELEYLMLTPKEQLKQAKRLNRKKIVRHKKGKMTAALRHDFNRLRTDENSIRMVANLLGEDVEYILDIIDEAENYSSEAKMKAMLGGSRIKEKNTRAKFEKIEKWMTSNAKKFDDPADLKKAINKRFGSNNILNQTAKKNGIPLFTQGFTNEILGLKGFSGDTSRLTSTLLDNVYKTTIYNFNSKVRKQLTKEITNVLSGGPAKVTEEARTKIKNNPLLKKFGFDQQINGPIAKLLFKEIGEDMYKNIQTFKQPRIGTDGLLKYLADEVNPKYKSMFMEAGRAIKAFQDRDRDGAAKFLKKGTKIMYDHKIPVSLIKNGYADEIEYVKITPTSEYFNAEIKNYQFDQPVNKLLRKYEKATGPQKNILFNEILNKKDDFSKKYGGYLDDVSITKDKVGKIKFSTSDKTPIFTKDTNIIKEFTKSSLQTGELNEKQVKKILASLSRNPKCKAGFFSGGRVGFQDGSVSLDKCALDGAKVVNSGKIRPGAESRNFAKFFNKTYRLGRGLLKFGIIPEALFVAGDTLVRMGMGDTLDEAFLRATEFFRFGDQTAEADKRQIKRLMRPESAKYMLNLRNFQKAQTELSDVIGAQQADLALAGTEFDEMSPGESQTDVIEKYKPKIAEKQKAVLDATISQPETLYARFLEDEFADIKGVRRGKLGPQKRQELNIVDPEDPETESLVTPEITQAELNKRIVEQQPTIAEDIFGDIASLTKTTPEQVLDFMKAQELTAEGTETAFQKVRKDQFERAYEDSALREALLGFNMPEPVDLENYQPSDRFQDFEMNRGIYALGGRIGFAEGPKDPNRRLFLKIMGGLMSLPIVGKFLKPAAPLVKKLSNTSTAMPDWFPNFVDKFVRRSIGKKIDQDIMKYELEELPGIEIYRHDDGKVFVSGENAYGKKYEIEYEPPGYEVIDEKTGKAVNKQGEFMAQEEVPVNVDPDGNADFDVEVLDNLDQILGPDTRNMEEFATGKTIKEMKSGEFSVGKAEADAERFLDEAAELDEID